MPCGRSTAQERDKRLRDDGNQQYIEVKGEFAHFVEDPYVEPGFAREPLTDEVDVVVIGGGFGGLLAGARLREAGVEDVRHDREGRRLRRDVVLEPLSGRGVRRRVVRLPAAARGDRLHPDEKYSRAPEILEHSRAIGEQFDLYDNACFQTEVTELRWDEAALRWIVSTNRGDKMRARFV